MPEQNPNASRLDGERFWETDYRGLVRLVAFGLGTGVLNAASHRVPLMFCADDAAAPFGVAIQPGDKLALVGYMAPVARQFEGKVAETVIFDKGRELAGHADVTPCALQAEVLPTCDIVVSSGTSVVNRTVENLLAMCPNAREFVLTGTSTPMFPTAYKGARHKPRGNCMAPGRQRRNLPHHRPGWRHDGLPTPVPERLRARVGAGSRCKGRLID